MKSVKLLLLLILTLSVAVPAFAKGPISDPPDNLLWPDAFYDYRDQGTWGRTDGGSEGGSGAYFQASIGVVLGGYLGDYGDVISVKAKHKGMMPNPEFTLIRDEVCTNWLGTGVQFWSLYLRGAPWMFQSEWKFIMEYNGTDGKVHSQTATKVTGDATFPIKPSHIKLERGDDEFTLSWSGIGDPYSSNVDYRIRIFDGGCAAWELRGNWGPPCPGSWSCSVTGTYDAGHNRVVFNIPLEWDGHVIRLENRINTPGQMSRATQGMVCSD